MMYEAGMNGVRINTAYGDILQYKDIIARVRSVGEIPVLLDLKGPELRVRVLKTLDLRADEEFTVGEGEDVGFNHPVYDQLRIGDRVLFDDAKIETEVFEVERGSLRLRVNVGGRLEDGKGVNCPGRDFDVQTLSRRDMENVEFARERGIEFLGLSFTRNVEDIRSLKKAVGDSEIGVVAKIENRRGVESFNEILSEVDGIMVARGDLGIEVPQETVPLLQKRMIAACNQAGKTVITATEMLESMIASPRPTRAEVSDVANAILDGTDVVMLSGETAIGKYPVDAVAAMTRIAVATEDAVECRVKEEKYQNISSTISQSVNEISRSMPLDKVITITRTGYTARAISRFKLRQPVIAVTSSSMVKRRLELVYGVYPVELKFRENEDKILAVANSLLAEGIVSEDELILFTAAFRTSQRHSSNLIEIHTIRELARALHREQKQIPEEQNQD